jgi:putative membrane protein
VRVVGLIGIISLITGRSPAVVGLAMLGAALLAAPFAVLAWRRFTYRVADGRLEVRSGVLTRTLRTIPLDRIRGVDISAPLLHRLTGLVQVRVDDAAGGASASGLQLAAVRRRDAEALREAVLSRRSAAPEAAAEPEGRVLAEVPLGTLALAGATSGRYLAVPVALLAAGLRAIRDADIGWVDDLAARGVDLVPTDPLGIAVLIVAAIALAAGAAALGSVIVDGGFRLVERPGRLAAERGLIGQRSVTIDRRRLRALEVRDSLPWRAVGLAALRAVVGGVPSGEGDARGRTALLPAGPADEVWRLAREIDPAAHDGLDRHPRTALSRRLVRATAVPAAGAVLAAVLAPWPVALALAAVAALMVPVGLDRYRSLGNRLEGGRLGLREGSLSRRHSLVVPDGVVAYRVSQSPFQRRAGLCTLTAFLGQGAGSRRALDVAPARAAGLLERLEPELVGPLLAAGTRRGEQ